MGGSGDLKIMLTAGGEEGGRSEACYPRWELNGSIFMYVVGGRCAVASGTELTADPRTDGSRVEIARARLAGTAAGLLCIIRTLLRALFATLRPGPHTEPSFETSLHQFFYLS